MMATVQDQKRRARKRSALVYEYTAEHVNARMSYWGNKCWMCGCDAETVDHVKPLSKGGKDCPANFRPACGKCNSTKNAKWYGVAELHRFVK
jgi:5-methylcytosine-specific restriction endonuclease McrA